ncbi:hypothetical protein HHK36_007515 [Tetracentron sinense]|uniref:Two-component response regulator n=1 Tax=Tetracentron sinense TaxID=13715 RepID=A0A834ZRX6_TETSI|nr:hypothetical protein HHK36_007515 [Tetracentron sinense]
MENGFSYPRTDAFPAGLRVLVVDDDPTWIKILARMLEKCSYRVTTCCLARDALNMLRERKDGFDIIISDVNMPDMDGFKLLEQVGLEMDLPVIMMSVDGERSRVMKGVQHGACDYLLKPVRMKELQNIWQHVFRKKILEVKDIESQEGIEDIQMMKYGLDEFDNGQLLSGGDMFSVKKRRDMENKEHDDQEFSDSSTVKKARVVWSVDLHQKFVNAVNQIGFDSDCHLDNACTEPISVIFLAEIGPKKILDLMNVPWLTRENIASHLQCPPEDIEPTAESQIAVMHPPGRQPKTVSLFSFGKKYRLYLSRLQKQNEPKTSFAGIKQSDFSSKDPPGSFDLQRSITMHQNNAANINFGYCGHKILVQDMDSQIHEGDLKGIVSALPIAEPKKALMGEIPDPQKTSSSSRMGLTESLRSLVPDVNYASFECTFSKQHCWSGEVPVMQLKQLKQEHDGNTHLPLPSPRHHIQMDPLQSAPSICPRTSIMERGKSGPIEIKPFYTEYRSNHVTSKSPVDSFSVQADSHIINSQDFEAISTFRSSMKNHGLNQNFINNSESVQPNSIPGNGSNLVPSHEDLEFFSLQGYGYTENIGLQNIEFSDYTDSELITELPGHLYNGLRLNCDYLDLIEYLTVDQGLFIT